MQYMFCRSESEPSECAGNRHPRRSLIHAPIQRWTRRTGHFQKGNFGVGATIRSRQVRESTTESRRLDGLRGRQPFVQYLCQIANGGCRDFAGSEAYSGFGLDAGTEFQGAE